MFGSRGLTGRYLTHVVPGVEAVNLLYDEVGRERALHISNSEGSTLITFTD
jgi:hypothetical protein